MHVTNGDSPSLKSDHVTSGPLGRAPAEWPLGRMVVVVFAICLATWIAVIAYFLGF